MSEACVEAAGRSVHPAGRVQAVVLAQCDAKCNRGAQVLDVDGLLEETAGGRLDQEFEETVEFGGDGVDEGSVCSVCGTLSVDGDVAELGGRPAGRRRRRRGRWRRSGWPCPSACSWRERSEWRFC